MVPIAVAASAALAAALGYLSMRLGPEARDRWWWRAINIVGGLAVMDALLVSRMWTSAVGLGPSSGAAGIAGIVVVDAGFLVGVVSSIRHRGPSR
jgi:hypothetical protein